MTVYTVPAQTINVNASNSSTIVLSSNVPAQNINVTATASNTITFNVTSVSKNSNISIPATSVVPALNSISNTFSFAVQSASNNAIVYYISVPAYGSVIVTASGGGNANATGTYDGMISVSGNTLVNGAGHVIQLRGGNMTGMENQPVQQYTPGNSNMGGVDPAWPVYKTWKPNSYRNPMNAASFLNLITYDVTGNASVFAWGATRNCNPTGTWLTTLRQNIQNARSIGCYVICDLHWTAPSLNIGGVVHNLSPLGQSPFIDAGMGTTFWADPVLGFPTWLATTFGSAAFNSAHGYNGGAAGAYYNSAYGGSSGFNDVIFEIYNEPFLKYNGGSFSNLSTNVSITADQAKFQGGWATIYNSQAPNADPLDIGWQMGSYHYILNAIRTNGFTNICVFNGDVWTQELENAPIYVPTDTLNPPQIAVGWHPYPQFNSTYPYTNSIGPWGSTGTDQYANTSNFFHWAPAAQANGWPVIITEDGGLGGTNATATPNAEPHMALMQALSDQYGWSYHFWQWNGPQGNTSTSLENYATIFTANANFNLSDVVPCLGEGSQCYNWMVNHA